MRTTILAASLLLTLCLAPLACAQETERSDIVIEKMAFKFVRGITNMVTSVVELPKQTYLTTRDRGAVGVATGPLKGIGMTIYRAFSGAVETVLFLVPQPGYYDSMINPDFVWKGWEETRPEAVRSKDGDPAEGSDGSKEK